MGDGEQRCGHTPQHGTIYTRTNLPESMARAGETVDAVCGGCGEPIRCEAYKAVGPAGAWGLKYIPEEVLARADRFREAHPWITIRADCRSAIWTDSDDDVIELVYSEPSDLLDRLEAEYGCPSQT